MSPRHRIVVAALLLLAILAFVVLVAFAGNACPTESERLPCPGAGTNRALVVGLASAGVALLVTPFAFLGETLAGRRIVYRGAWARATRRGVLVGLVVAILAGLRLGDALSVPVVIFIVLVAGVAEWLAVRRDG